MSSLLACEAEEKDYDAPEQPEQRQVSSALADEAEKEVECRHAPEKEPAECPDRHSLEEEAVEEAGALTRRRRRRSALTRRNRPVQKVDELLPP